MFWPFRLLIAALMAMVVLVLIMSAIEYFQEMKIQVSLERLEKGFDSAWGAITTPGEPGKGLKVEEGLTLPATTIGSESFARRFNLDYTCIEMQSIARSSIEESPNGYSVKVKQKTTTDVYFLCVYDELNTHCKEKCYISFGKKPTVA